MSKIYVKRYSIIDRLMHWSVALGFVLLSITGFVIFFQGSASLLNSNIGSFIRILHRIGAVLFIAAPILYLLFSKKRWAWSEAFKWDKSDIGWLKAAPKHYFIGGDGMPPQGKYNTGQKLYYLFALICGLLLAVSGLALWFDWFAGKTSFIVLIIHDLSAVILVAFFFVHLYLTSIHPRERKSFEAMATGMMEEEYAKHHHERWYNEVKETDLVVIEENKNSSKLKPITSNNLSH